MADTNLSSIPPGHFEDRQWHTLVLGIGNVLWADEGFGVRTVETLHERYCFPEDVCVMDGGTQGIFLLPWVRSTQSLLIFDAIDFGLAPGELRLIRDDAVPRFMGAKKVSMHQAGFQEVLASAALSGDYPERLALIGVQPDTLNDYGGSLRPAVKARIPEALALALDVLREWGVEIRERESSPGAADATGPVAMNIHDYEAGRPEHGH